jgi:putative membrane protein
MLSILRRSALVPAAWVGMLALAACETRARPEATGEAPAAATDTAMPPAAEPVAALTDANIVALLDEANQADSAAGAFARDKATDPQVKSYARLMMSEHHMLRAQGQTLAKQLKLTPEPPANDPVKAAAETEMAALRSTPKGQQFDRTYIDQEVAVHKAVIDLAEQAHGTTQNEQLKALIEKAKPFLEKHLERAEELQGKLGKASA